MYTTDAGYYFMSKALEGGGAREGYTRFRIRAVTAEGNSVTRGKLHIE